jgi:hypothetical protein
MVVGTYAACTIEKIKALLSVATNKAAYGPVAQWSCSTISEAGILMGRFLIFDKGHDASEDDTCGIFFKRMTTNISI